MTEYLAENSRLRQLSRRYSEGQVSFGEYRAVRREILVALEAGEVQVGAAPLHDEPVPTGVTQPPRPVENDAVFLKTMPPRASADEPEAMPAAEPGAAAVAPVPAGWDSHTRILAIVLGVVALLALAGLIYVMVL